MPKIYADSFILGATMFTLIPYGKFGTEVTLTARSHSESTLGIVEDIELKDLISFLNEYLIKKENKK